MDDSADLMDMSCEGGDDEEIICENSGSPEVRRLITERGPF